MVSRKVGRRSREAARIRSQYKTPPTTLIRKRTALLVGEMKERWKMKESTVSATASVTEK